MSERARTLGKTTAESVDDLPMDVSQLHHLAENLALKSRLNELKALDHLVARRFAEKKTADMMDTVTTLEIDAKLATSCVHTQYKMLQRLFLLRSDEARDTVIRMTRELESVKAQAQKEISLRDRELAERDARIEQLETHLNSMHYQLTGVLFDSLSRLEASLTEALELSGTLSDDFHKKAKEELIDCSLDIKLI